MGNLKQIINLTKKGERLVVVNDQGEPQFVVMNIAEYENLTNGESEDIRGLTEEELLAKINRDIAVWKADQKVDEQFAADENFIDQEAADSPPLHEVAADSPPLFDATDNESASAKATADKDDKYYFEPVDEDEEELEDDVRF